MLKRLHAFHNLLNIGDFDDAKQVIGNQATRSACSPTTDNE
jgi:hypothetical protein